MYIVLDLDRKREVNFVMKLILNEIYDKGGSNAKFIPILFAHCTEFDIPSVLRCASSYKMPHDLPNLVRRMKNLEKYKLQPSKAVTA